MDYKRYVQQKWTLENKGNARRRYNKNCRHKKRFPTEEDALRERDRYNNQVVMQVREFNAYYCNKHKSWHVGHSETKKESKKIAELMTWHRE